MFKVFFNLAWHEKQLTKLRDTSAVAGDVMTNRFLIFSNISILILLWSVSKSGIDPVSKLF